MQVTITVYDKTLASKILANVKASGFKLFKYDNPSDAAGVKLYYNGNKQVRTDYNAEEKAYNFYYSIAE